MRRQEVDDIFNALEGKRQLTVLKGAGHDHIMQDDPTGWTKAVWEFLES